MMPADRSVRLSDRTPLIIHFSGKTLVWGSESGMEAAPAVRSDCFELQVISYHDNWGSSHLDFDVPGARSTLNPLCSGGGASPGLSLADFY